MQKTLGGDRINSGNKMTVELHTYERSTHDRSYPFRTTMSAGTIVPFLCKPALPGDTWDINLNCDVKTHPTVGPLFGSYAVELNVFTADIRLYQRMLHNNKQGIGLEMNTVKLPVIELQATNIPDDHPDPDNAQINPSCIWSYLGIRGVGSIEVGDETPTRTFNGVPFLMYWDIYKNYYANQQEERGAVIHANNPAITETVDAITINAVALPQSPATTDIQVDTNETILVTSTGATPVPSEIIFNTDKGPLNLQQICGASLTLTNDGTWQGTFDIIKYGTTHFTNWNYIDATQIPIAPPTVQFFDLVNLDTMRETILAAPTGAPFNISASGIEPYIWPSVFENERNPMLNSQEGLALKTYKSDLFNNWLNTEKIAGTGGINDITSISTTGDKFTINALILAEKVFDYLNRVQVSGGTYDDWLDVTYEHERYTKPESPVFHGGLIKELVFQEVISNSASAATGEQPLGTLAGKGIMSNKHKGGNITIKPNDPCYIMGLVTITPRIDYSQGNEWDTHLQTMDDFHKPALDQIGFQDLVIEQMAYWTTSKTLLGAWTTKACGLQPAWTNYMTETPKCKGNFAIKNNEMFMTLNRRYEKDGTDINDMTTYIDPVKFNHIFAQTTIDAQNFWVQIAVNITCRQKMSGKIMPTL